MSLREMRWTDLDELAALERDLFPHDAWAEPTWWSELAGRPQRHFVVEEDASGIAGYGGLNLGSEVADVMTIAVAPRAQGRGLGRTLLEGLVERARQDGAEYLMLEVRDDNLPPAASTSTPASRS